MSLHVAFRLSRPSLVLDVRMVIPSGITVVLGPSGAGKSTTLSVIAGLTCPDEGRISLGDEHWFASPSGELIAAHQRRIGFVFQSLALFPHLSALDNVAFGIPRVLPRKQRLERAAAMLAQVRAEHLARRLPHALSGGEAQRVALARALASEPRVMLLDEPFASLDVGLRRDLGDELSAYLRDLAIPVLWVTHALAEARSIGSQFVHMQAGSIIASGEPALLLADERC